MKTLLVTLGSAGDLHPFLAVAKALAARGDDVEVMSNAPYEDAVRHEGLAFTPLCSERDHRRTAEHPDLWHPVRGFGVLWRHLAVPAIEPVRARVRTLLGQEGGAPAGGLRVLASPLAVGARIARAQAAYPLCSVYTAPANLRSTGDPMYLGSWHVPVWFPLPARSALWWALDARKLEPMARPVIDGALHVQGLPPARGSLFGRWIHSPDGGLALFPPSFCPPQADWPLRVEMGDFPLFRARADDCLADGLERFLAAGAAPVVIFPGSAPGGRGRTLLTETLAACRALGLRAVALGPAAMEAPAPAPGPAGPSATPADVSRAAAGEDPEFVHRCSHAALELLLPRAAVFVHHGGIGSCAQGLRARVPQLIRPLAYDQFDNAARIEQEGGGRFIPRGAKARGAFLSALNDLAEGGGAIGSSQQIEPLRGVDAVLAALRRWESPTTAKS